MKREKRSSKDDTVKEIRRRAQAAGAWPPICVFPEGGRITCILFQNPKNVIGKCNQTFLFSLLFPNDMQFDLTICSNQMLFSQIICSLFFTLIFLIFVCLGTCTNGECLITFKTGN